jgi:hypothetical protein
MSNRAEERYVHTQQRSHLRKGLSKKPDMHPETSSTGIDLASISYALYLETDTQARYMLLQNHINKEPGGKRTNNEVWNWNQYKRKGMFTPSKKTHPKMRL